MVRELYDPKLIEPKWQDRWESDGLYKTTEDTTRPKWYALTMFAYPSGDIHAGHWFAFIPTDAAARWRRMNGYNVFLPVGFDAFGLPAENAAIKRNIHPKEWTYANIAKMRLQLKRMGSMWAWDREAITCDQGYYKWTQWFFLKFFESGLTYREYAPVDWCPGCNTTLAREQVWGEERYCERCRTPVIKKNLEQWKFRITKYADELLDDLKNMQWPDCVKTMQTNWIGRSEGAEIDFKICDISKNITVFTSRPETLWGATFIVLSPEHPFVEEITDDTQLEAVHEYQRQSARKDEMSRTSLEKEMTGVFTGGYVINPATNESIPIWIADYVLMGYGTGAIMAVPAHDQRDFAFATKFSLPIRRVVRTIDDSSPILSEAYESKTEGVLVDSGDLNGTPVAEGFKKAVDWLETKGKGKSVVNYRLRDWLISRQRMWGTPIPIIYCPTCGTVPVPYENLPVLLPDDAQFLPTGESPLKHHHAFRFVNCPKCGTKAERETDTMDTFVCSSWYQYAYVSPYHKKDERLTSNDLPWEADKGNYWLPVDQYTGGIEHATMHLLYTRFFTKALRDIGIVRFDEPMQRLFNQGMILGPDGEKMSKSRGNVINPEAVVDQYGTDTVRGYMMFLGPWDQGGPWNPKGIEGVSRFLQRVFGLVVDEIEPTLLKQPDTIDARSVEQTFHQTIINVTEGMTHFRFNTVVADFMEFSNLLLKVKLTSISTLPIWKEMLNTFVALMAPLFPYISEELWHRMGHTESVHLQKWPQADLGKAQGDTVTMVVQVNSKLRSEIRIPRGTPSEMIKKDALKIPEIQKWIAGKTIQKIVVVENRLVNIVITQ